MRELYVTPHFTEGYSHNGGLWEAAFNYAINPEFAKQIHDVTVQRFADDVLKNYKELTEGK